MPLIDVLDVLFDPVIAAEAFTVTRRKETVGQNGRTQIVSETLNGVGSIQPATPQALRRLPEGTRVEGSISVYTSLRLMMQTETQQPDEISWGGRSYQVADVRDWTHFGGGFVNATCILTDLLDNVRA
jgi:galactose-6-phosphate isomerase